MIFRTPVCLTGLLLCLPLLAAQTPEAVFPRNPSIQHDAVYVSANGVGRYERVVFRQSWHALAGVRTFEPVVAGELVLVGSGNGLYALDRGTGAVAWHIAPATTVYSPVVVGAAAYAASRNGVLRAVDLRDGAEVWTRRFEGWLYPPAFDQGILITGGRSGRVYGIDARSADLVWTTTVSQELVYRPVLGAPGQVLTTTFSGDLYAIASATGQTLWRVTEAAAGFPPLVHDGRLYMGAFDGSLRARSLIDGSLIWIRSIAEDELPYLPYLHGGQLVVASENGSVSALDLGTGRVSWRKELHVNLAVAPIVLDHLLIAVDGKGELSVHPLPEP